jgi:hypothetical protein
VLHWLKKYSEAIALFVIAALLACGTEFALRCQAERHQMTAMTNVILQRQQACLDLKWRWEADDQEHQYKGSSAGSRVTVGPISGYVMDVTENEFGHAVGQCHVKNASYSDLISQF